MYSILNRALAVFLLLLLVLAPIREARADVDTDADGLPDNWEQNFFQGLSYSAGDDPDADTLPNILEYQIRTHPNDKDSDGVSDVIDPGVDTLASKYFVLAPNTASGPLEIMSLADGNQITAGGVSLSLDRLQSTTLTAGTLSPGDAITAIAPICVASSQNGSDLPVPVAFAGTAFVIPHIRNSHSYHLFSPYGDAIVTANFGNGPEVIHLPMGERVIASGGSDNTLSVLMESDLPILVAHTSGTNDVFPVPPADPELVGIRTRNCLVGALYNGTNVAVYADNGTTANITVDRGQRLAISTGANTAEGAGSAIHLVADKPIGAVQYADSDGSEATAFHHPDYFSKELAIPVDAQYIAVASLHDATSVTYYPTPDAPESHILNSSGLFPGKLYFGSSTDGANIPAGASLKSDKPIYAIYEASAVNDEHNIIGGSAPNSRLIYTDIDEDGLLDVVEDKNSNGQVDDGETDPANPDSDSDGLGDGIEDSNHDGNIDDGETDPVNPDSDSDGLEDGIEDSNHNGNVDTGELDPRLSDSDTDGLPDGWEVVNGLNPTSNDAAGDLDGDTLSNADEYLAGTRADRVDTDFDGDADNTDPCTDVVASRYYLLNPEIILSGLSVVSLFDGNTISAGSEVLHLGAGQAGNFPAGSLSLGQLITATAPFSIGSARNGTDMPVSELMAGTHFVIPHIRKSHRYYLLSPYGDASVQVDTGSGVLPAFLSKGQIVTIDAGEDNNSSGVLTSNLPILVYHAGISGTTTIDAFPVPPASIRLAGVRTNNVLIGAIEVQTTVDAYAQDGSHLQLSIDSGGRVLLNTGSNGSQGQGNAIFLVADKPIGAVQYADSDGTEATAFMPPTFFGTDYFLPVDTQYLSIVGIEENTSITVSDGVNPDSTASLSGSAKAPGKAYFGSPTAGVNFVSGTRISSDKPVFLIYEASGPNDEHNLLGKTQFSEADHLPDTDEDGLADFWEYLNFGGLAFGPADDPDGDGILNDQEYRQGSDPQGEASIVFTASVLTIDLGESVTLQWDVDGADTVEIQPGIGTVTDNGSIIVTPEATSTYTLSATAGGQTLTSNLTITVIEPPPGVVTVTLEANPQFILTGESATLTWSSEYADTVTIEPDIGAVSSSGSISVSPAATTIYSIIADGAAGSSTATVTVAVSTPITVQITSPQDGAVLAKKAVMVEGTLTNHLGYETGVTVNGVVALVDDNYFVASNIPLDQGENTIIAKAIDTSGNEIEYSIIVLADTENQNIRLNIDPKSGTAPFETKLEITGPSPIQHSSVEITGPAEAEITENGAESYQLNFTIPGLYVVTVTAEDGVGMSYHDSVGVNVYDRDELGLLLEPKWNTMKNSLSAGDIQGALSVFKRETQTIYEGIFTDLGDQLPQIALEMQELEMIYTNGSVAVYRTKRTETHQGQSYEITYKVYFDCTEDGIWKINRF